MPTPPTKDEKYVVFFHISLFGCQIPSVKEVYTYSLVTRVSYFMYSVFLLSRSRVYYVSVFLVELLSVCPTLSYHTLSVSCQFTWKSFSWIFKRYLKKSFFEKKIIFLNSYFYTYNDSQMALHEPVSSFNYLALSKQCHAI